MRLYANENFPRQVVDALKELGHDVLTTVEAGNANRSVSDWDVLAFASRHGRAVVTLNRRDFIRLAATTEDHAGIVVCTQDPDGVGQARRIHAALGQKTSLQNQLLRVTRTAP